MSDHEDVMSRSRLRNIITFDALSPYRWRDRLQMLLYASSFHKRNRNYSSCNNDFSFRHERHRTNHQVHLQHLQPINSHSQRLLECGGQVSLVNVPCRLVYLTAMLGDIHVIHLLLSLRLRVSYGCVSEQECTDHDWTLEGPGCESIAVTQGTPDIFLVSVLLFAMTFGIAYTLRSFRNSNFFPTFVSLEILHSFPAGVPQA